MQLRQKKEAVFLRNMFYVLILNACINYTV